MAKRTFAELLIVAGIENEVVPQLIHHLRRHRHRLFIGEQRTTEKLPQAGLHQRQLRVVERRIGLPHALQQTRRQLILVDEIPSRLRGRTPPHEHDGKAEKSQGNDNVEPHLGTIAKSVAQQLQAAAINSGIALQGTLLLPCRLACRPIPARAAGKEINWRDQAAARLPVSTATMALAWFISCA